MTVINMTKSFTKVTKISKLNFPLSATVYFSVLCAFYASFCFWTSLKCIKIRSLAIAVEWNGKVARLVEFYQWKVKVSNDRSRRKQSISMKWLQLIQSVGPWSTAFIMLRLGQEPHSQFYVNSSGWSSLV